MKKILAAAVGISLAIAPCFALADTSAQAQIRQLTAVAAALEAQIAALQGGQSLACAAIASTPSVAVDASFALAWGSVGATALGSEAGVSMWSPNGASDIAVSQPGLWTYYFTFYALNGASTTCTAEVNVTPAR